MTASADLSVISDQVGRKQRSDHRGYPASSGIPAPVDLQASVEAAPEPDPGETAAATGKRRSKKTENDV